MSDEFYRITAFAHEPTFDIFDTRLLDWLRERARKEKGVWIEPCYMTITRGTIKDIIRLRKKLGLDAETVAAFQQALDAPNALTPSGKVWPLTDHCNVRFFMF